MSEMQPLCVVSSDVIVPRPPVPHEVVHRERLTRLVQNLKLIDEKPTRVKYTIVDTIWRPEGSRGQIMRMPDLIAVRRGDSALIAELKHSERHRHAAMEQLFNGMDFARYELGITDCEFKFVLYHDDETYSYERIRPAYLRGIFSRK